MSNSRLDGALRIDDVEFFSKTVWFHPKRISDSSIEKIGEFFNNKFIQQRCCVCQSAFISKITRP